MTEREFNRYYTLVKEPWKKIEMQRLARYAVYDSALKNSKRIKLCVMILGVLTSILPWFFESNDEKIVVTGMGALTTVVGFISTTFKWEDKVSSESKMNEVLKKKLHEIYQFTVNASYGETSEEPGSYIEELNVFIDGMTVPSELNVDKFDSESQTNFENSDMGRVEYVSEVSVSELRVDFNEIELVTRG